MRDVLKMTTALPDNTKMRECERMRATSGTSFFFFFFKSTVPREGLDVFPGHPDVALSVSNKVTNSGLVPVIAGFSDVARTYRFLT